VPRQLRPASGGPDAGSGDARVLVVEVVDVVEDETSHAQAAVDDGMIGEGRRTHEEAAPSP